MKNDKTIFLQIFGDSPILRVLDFLIVNDDFDYSMTDIAELSGIGYATLKLFWPELEKNEIVIKTRDVGKAKLYKLNDKNIIVQKFKEFYWETVRHKVNATIKVKVIA